MSTYSETYSWYKQKGICIKCRSEKAEPGKTMCLMCSTDDNERSKKYYHNKMSEEQKKNKRRKNNRKRDICVALGVCRNCLKKDATQGQFCLECYIKHKLRNKNIREKKQLISRSERVSNGQCYFCGQPVVEGKRTCIKCLNIRQECIKSNKYNNNQHVWR